jgi:hypothetical protein
MRHYRSFFWPVVLILAGVVALLVNAGVVSSDRLSLLVDLWPLILIVIGLELIARRGLQGAAGDVAAVLIVLVAAGGALAYIALAPNPNASHKLDTSADVGALDHASLHVDAGAATITVTASSVIAGDLYRAHIEYSGSRPEVNLDRSNGTLRISQGSAPFLQSRRFTLDLKINSSLPWAIATDSGAATNTFNLANAHISSIEINTGASREDITLGRPAGTVPITINGGSLTVRLHRPAGTAASVRVSGGAVSLDADGEPHRGIGSQTWSSADAGSATNSYRVEVNGGACNVTIDATGTTA